MGMYHMWRTMQVGTSTRVPYSAHDEVKVLSVLSACTYHNFLELLDIVENNYLGRLQLEQLFKYLRCTIEAILRL